MPKGIKGYQKGHLQFNHWKGKKHSEEAKEKMRIAKLGKPILKLRGIPRPESVKEKMRATMFKKGFTPWNKGKPHPVARNNPQVFKKGIHYSPKTEFKKGQNAGANHPSWKGGISRMPNYSGFTSTRRKIRKLENGGCHTIADWENLKAQYNWTCPSCKRSEPEIKLTEDHIIPLSKGGSDNIENIQPLCASCNSKKRTKIVKYNV